MNLNNIRRQRFEPLFDKVLGDLMTTCEYDVTVFEQALIEGLNCQKDDLKEFVLDLSRIKRYETIAVYFMEHSLHPLGPAQEFHDRLATFYGIVIYNWPDRPAATKRYWDRNLPEAIRTLNIQLPASSLHATP